MLFHHRAGDVDPRRELMEVEGDLLVYTGLPTDPPPHGEGVLVPWNTTATESELSHRYSSSSSV